MPPDPHSSTRIRWTIQRHERLASTNAAALELAREAFLAGRPISPAVVIAETQSAGRGQHGRAWESPPGGLYLSAVVEDVSPSLRDALAVLAGAAAAHTLQHHLAREGIAGTVGLRWPNDLMLGERKVGGILCEAVSVGHRWAGVIGIGLNINTKSFPGALEHTATSLLLHTGRRHDARLIEGFLLTEVAETLTRAAHEGLAPAVRRFRRFDILAGKTIEFAEAPASAQAPATLSGTAAGIGDAGELLVDTPAGPRALRTATLVSVAGVRCRG